MKITNLSTRDIEFPEVGFTQENLRAIRRAGYRYETVAAICGVGLRSTERWFGGQREMSAQTWKTLFDAVAAAERGRLSPEIEAWLEGDYFVTMNDGAPPGKCYCPSLAADLIVADRELLAMAHALDGPGAENCVERISTALADVEVGAWVEVDS